MVLLSRTGLLLQKLLVMCIFSKGYSDTLLSFSSDPCNYPRNMIITCIDTVDSGQDLQLGRDDITPKVLQCVGLDSRIVVVHCNATSGTLIVEVINVTETDDGNWQCKGSDTNISNPNLEATPEKPTMTNMADVLASCEVCGPVGRTRLEIISKDYGNAVLESGSSEGEACNLTGWDSTPAVRYTAFTKTDSCSVKGADDATHECIADLSDYSCAQGIASVSVQQGISYKMCWYYILLIVLLCVGILATVVYLVYRFVYLKNDEGQDDIPFSTRTPASNQAFDAKGNDHLPTEQKHVHGFAPEPPRNLTYDVENEPEFRVTLAWKPPSKSGEHLSYQITAFQKRPGAQKWEEVFTKKSPKCEKVLNGLSRLNRYKFEVRAKNDAGTGDPVTTRMEANPPGNEVETAEM